MTSQPSLQVDPHSRPWKVNAQKQKIKPTVEKHIFKILKLSFPGEYLSLLFQFTFCTSFLSSTSVSSDKGPSWSKQFLRQPYLRAAAGVQKTLLLPTVTLMHFNCTGASTFCWRSEPDASSNQLVLEQSSPKQKIISGNGSIMFAIHTFFAAF